MKTFRDLFHGKKKITLQMNLKQRESVMVAKAMCHRIIAGKGHCPVGFAHNTLKAFKEAGL